MHPDSRDAPGQSPRELPVSPGLLKRGQLPVGEDDPVFGLWRVVPNIDGQSQPAVEFLNLA